MFDYRKKNFFEKIENFVLTNHIIMWYNFSAAADRAGQLQLIKIKKIKCLANAKHSINVTMAFFQKFFIFWVWV